MNSFENENPGPEPLFEAERSGKPSRAATSPKTSAVEFSRLAEITSLFVCVSIVTIVLLLVSANGDRQW
jgi:hypothetical protein